AGLEVHLVEDSGRKLIDALLEGGVHGALLGMTGELPERFDRWRLFEESYLVAVAPTHPFVHREAIPIAELARTQWVEREECEAHCLLDRLCCDGGSKPRIVNRGRQEDHVQHMAAGGLGALLVAEHMPRLADLVVRPIERDALRRTVELVVVAGRQYPPAL